MLSWPDGQLHPAVSDWAEVRRRGGGASHPEISPAGQALSGRQLQPGDAVLPAADCHGVAGGLLQLIFRGLLGELSPLPAGLDAGAFAADDCARAAGRHGGAEPHRQLMGGADAAECWAGGYFDWGFDSLFGGAQPEGVLAVGTRLRGRVHDSFFGAPPRGVYAGTAVPAPTMQALRPARVTELGFA